MQAEEGLSLEQIRAFLQASEPVCFQGRNREEVYGWVNQVLRHQDYDRLDRSGRGLVRRYLEKMTGLSRAQVTRLIGQYLDGEEVKPKPYRRHRFPHARSRHHPKNLAKICCSDRISKSPHRTTNKTATGWTGDELPR